jgi:hypothetical protein
MEESEHGCAARQAGRMGYPLRAGRKLKSFFRPGHGLVASCGAVRIGSVRFSFALRWIHQEPIVAAAR